jgi:hypothetical protein
LQPLHLAEEKEAEHLGLLGAWLGLSLTLGTVGKRTEKKMLKFCRGTFPFRQLVNGNEKGWGLPNIDQISIKTPKPKFLLYWCLIDFIDWRYSQSCWYFRPLL